MWLAKMLAADQSNAVTFFYLTEPPRADPTPTRNAPQQTPNGPTSSSLGWEALRRGGVGIWGGGGAGL